MNDETGVWLFSAAGIRVRFKWLADRIDYLITFEIADLLWWFVSKTIVSSLFRTGKSNRRRMDFWCENAKNVIYLPRIQSESPAGFSRGWLLVIAGFRRRRAGKPSSFTGRLR